MVDMFQMSGKFPVSYDMFSTPDHLIIQYEDTRLFDTGGPVPGAASTNVTFSGSSTLVKVTIRSPKANKDWKIYIGCPFP